MLAIKIITTILILSLAVCFAAKTYLGNNLVVNETAEYVFAGSAIIALLSVTADLIVIVWTLL